MFGLKVNYFFILKIAHGVLIYGWYISYTILLINKWPYAKWGIVQILCLAPGHLFMSSMVYKMHEGKGGVMVIVDENGIS